MTTVDPTTLRPDIRAEEARLGNGHTVTVYRCPFPSQGPVRVTSAPGWVTLKFMYAHFVFTWPRSSQTVDIGHGTLDSAMPLWNAQPIYGEWSEQNLTHFGESWVRGHLRRFALREEGESDDA